jgi:flavin reductase (DIM6/NTAB) family NADH-FMN oxidoreductase RutF
MGDSQQNIPHDLVAVPLPKSYRLVGHGPTILLSTTDGKVANAAAVQWLMPADYDPPYFLTVIAAGQKTQENLALNGECVINLPVASQVELVKRLGSTSGHDAVKLSDDQIFPSTIVAAPKIKGCAAWIEARVDKIISAEHEVYLLRAVAAHAQRGAVSERWQFNIADFPTLHHIGNKVFGVCRSTNEK